MSASYTVGPWECQTPMGDHCPWIVKGGQQAYEWEPIATLGDCTEDGPSPRSKAFREVQANARLIAAAPDLVEALQLLFTVAAMSKYERGDERPVFDDASYDRAMNKARTALSKALNTSTEGEG